MRDNFSVAKNVHDLDKEAYHIAKFQTFDCSHKTSPTLYFDRLLLLKVYKIQAKKVHSSHVSSL